MTPAEKEKLYKAIGYQEGDLPAEFPTTFVATTCEFVLQKLELKIFDEEITVLYAGLNGVKCSFQQRPAANAIR